MNGFLQLIGIYAVVLLVPVTGITFTVNPNKVVFGSTGDMIYMRCAFLGEQNVDSLTAMQIQRLTGNTWETLALLKPSSDPITSLTDPLPSDLQSKGLSVSDSFDPNNHINTDLTLTIPRNNIQCSDARDYRCSIIYLEVTGDTYESRTVSMNDTLMAAELPVITSLVGKKNGYIDEGPSPSHPASFGIGDILELTCTANIGSFDYTTIKWRQSSETTTDFIDYIPLSGTFTPGTATSNGQCGYTRIASITYNTTSTDVNRPNNLAFKCYVTVTGSPYSNDYTTASNLSFYADVTSSTTEPKGEAATAGSGDVGIIAGGVIGGLILIVLVVLLVYFLWYRRRSSGQDYQTKEEYGAENPNMAPATSDLYAVPNKLKTRGHENPGLDEPHEARRHNDRNSRGRANYGMDHDADADAYDSRDGSPSMTDSRDGINHMGMDPRDGSIGTGV